MKIKQSPLAFFIIIMSLSFSARAASPEGFYVWSDGDHSNRELKYQQLKEGVGPVGEIKTVTKRGEFSDIQCVISFDGRYVAFARELKKIQCCYDGPGDLHQYGNYDIYVVRVDGDLPAEAKKVGHGYKPSWGDDSGLPTKTLYYNWVSGSGREAGQELRIKKAVIGPDGSVSEPQDHIPLSDSPRDPAMQCSPDGRYVAGRLDRGRFQIYDSKTEKYSISFGGDHPSWGSDSRWLYLARNTIVAVVDGEIDVESRVSVPWLYFCGFSPDMKWLIGRNGARRHDQGTPHPLELRSGVFSKTGELVLGSTKHELDLPKGTSCDVHVKNSLSVGRMPVLSPMFNTRLGTREAGPALFINTLSPGNFTGGLYDMSGRRRIFINLTGRREHVIPLTGIGNGAYFFRLNTGRVSTLKKIAITH